MEKYNSIEKTYKIPEGSDAVIDNLVSIGIERFLKKQMDTPIESKPEFQEAVDSYRAENKMELKYAISTDVAVDEVIEKTNEDISPTPLEVLEKTEDTPV